MPCRKPLGQLKDPQLKALAGAEWAKMPEAAACSKALIGWLASYIARDYRTEDADRKPLKGSTAVLVWGGLLFQTVERFKGKETTPEGKSLGFGGSSSARLWPLPCCEPKSGAPDSDGVFRLRRRRPSRSRCDLSTLTSAGLSAVGCTAS